MGWGDEAGATVLDTVALPPQRLPSGQPRRIRGHRREDTGEDIAGLRGGGDNDVTCVELYGSVGTIGLHVSDLVLDLVSSLVCSDENPNNGRCFADSVLSPPPDVQLRLAYLRKNAADIITTELPLLRGCCVLINDPHRKGLDVEVVDYLCREGWRGGNMKLVVYVSCGFRAFQRDCDTLMRSGRWKFAFAEGYLLSPGSDAIETLAFFVPA